MEGIVLGNRYELQEKIGEGGMSEVFKARCNKLNRFVAVKILKKEFCNNADIVEKFKGEATAIATLSDNNIVNILDVGTQDGINYIVMEYVKGKTLKDVIKQVGKMNYETGISVAIQIAKALDCAHRNKIIHRDVKPQNILVTEDGVMKVTDFGIAKSTTSSTITNTSTIMGSAHYLSPEQAKGSFIDCRTDLYSLGVVLYEMVTGVVPFQGDSAVTIALKHIQEDVVPPKNLNSKIPDSLNKLILKAMEKEPSKRYQTSKEMIADLQKIKNNPNAIIDENDDDDGHTIIMPVVTEEITRQNDLKNKSSRMDEEEYEDDEYDYDDDYDDEKDSIFSKNKGKIKKTLIGIMCVLLLGVVAVGGYKLISNTGTKEVEVPNLVGMNIDEAKTKLESLNLVLVEAGTEVSDKPEGTILNMNKDAGSKVKENTEIRVIISGGETKLKMPDLIESSVDTAKTILNAYGLKISNTTEDYSDDIPKGKIISQNPAKDTEVTENTEIEIVVSKGPEIKVTTVPSVVGLKLEDAQNKLSKSNLNISIKEEVTEKESDDGVVLSQNIESGAVVAQGNTVTITVGKYVPKKQEDENKGNGNTNNNQGNENNNGSNETENPNTDTGGSNTGDTSKPIGPWDTDNQNKSNSANKTKNQINNN